MEAIRNQNKVEADRECEACLLLLTLPAFTHAFLQVASSRATGFSWIFNYFSVLILVHVLLHNAIKLLSRQCAFLSSLQILTSQSFSKFAYWIEL
ncbi:hypothetical protein Sjap_016518 [Stephania japonica]|uniref:Uncharacterized protein n=1 Tax=Stephania japonica TaxID=461633 RepID=A0AAP0IMS4_9MAGN